MAQMDELPEQHEAEEDNKRQNGDMRRCGHAGHKNQRGGQQSLRFNALLRGLHRLIDRDEKHEVRRRRNCAARDHGGVDDVKENVRDPKRAHDYRRN